MIGVVIPVHDEEAHLGACLDSVLLAATHPGLGGEPVRVLVVLDSCSDGSAAIAHAYGVETRALQARNVGRARGEGARTLLEAGARWIACTDADSVVDANWLVDQLEMGAELVCGTVQVADWDDLPEHVRDRYEQHYCDADDHRHVHGANLGFCARAYLRAGGFAPLPAHEDVHLVQAFARIGARIAWSARPRVYTSARLLGRTPEGFAGYLRALLASS
ncbi:glycosyltransferase [Metapseudomonas otitidis]|uniref:glycosyltransferase n=1 Tax=Metapseudomonas otitidis TaxID=319939 RepID=UPI002446C904|nr:glycosyltransferase family A protein [Pseudomonas otitidis]MDG9779665.1 glycosyltransferase family 2 protein [Pseudomonas otitidis]